MLADPAARSRGVAARTMVAEDARWGMDVILSGQGSDISGYLPLLLGHHWVRIAYEGARVLRSPDPLLGVPALAELLRSRFSAITAQGRHAAKLLDDTKKSYDQVLGELEAVLGEHSLQLTGRTPRWLRWAATDLGLYEIDGRVAGASVSAGYRLGVEVADGGRLAGQDVRAVSEEWGGTLAVLGAAALDASAPVATMEPLRMLRIGYRDRLASQYFRGRFDPDFTLGLKATLLLIEGDLNASLRLLPLTGTGHEQAVFRAQTITVYHALTALRRVVQRYADSDVNGLRAVRAALQDPPANRLLSKQGRLVRNHCMHYSITDPQVCLDPSQPMYGLVEAIFPGNTWQDFRADVLTTTASMADHLHSWRPG